MSSRAHGGRSEPSLPNGCRRDPASVACPKNAQPSEQQCAKLINVTSAAPAREPKNFSNGMAVCYFNSKSPSGFLTDCMFLTMVATTGKKYIKAMVGPAMSMGGGGTGMADAFVFKCQFPRGTMKTGLTHIRDAFGLKGTYKLNDGVEINAVTDYQSFDAAKKWGRFAMIGAGSLQQTNLDNIIFRGQWGEKGIDNKALPLFVDSDAERFRKIFEAASGVGATCQMTWKPSDKIDLR